MQLSLLLRYYDPELAHHVFDKLECKPELFAISWFLTIFAHVLPVRKCTVVWDFVFGSGSPEATVCLACAVMLELRDSLMHASDFPTVVSLLSGSFAAMDVLHLLEEASLLLASTPTSVLEPALSDPVTASLVKTSCCCLLSPADIAGLKHNLDSTVDAKVNGSWASKGGVLLLDIRTNDERRRGWGGGQNNLTSSSASAAQQSRNITSMLQANKIISGAVEVAFDTLRGWREEEPIGNEDEHPDDFVMVDAADGRGSEDDDDHHIHREGAMDGEPVLRLLGRPHMLWYPAAPNTNIASSITAASSSSSSSAAFAGAAAISESPHVVIITGTEPEDGQSAVESLQRLGVAKVSMLLGGIKALEAAVPYVVIATT
ncbi:GPI-anchored surface protein, putative [Bodo saltans]|uniref:GPI-anchored surface protein, putative n=1 Tax=Bodo saltans TaxID=75058 RepID=A0A0S4KGX6_BODSA|nr:GPI-anchored surface protein, putative [Bodo saltans]|eukprot:CUI11134.1 GPI-anchored surface protein, putative [Bodo saltans]